VSFPPGVPEPPPPPGFPSKVEDCIARDCPSDDRFVWLRPGFFSNLLPEVLIILIFEPTIIAFLSLNSFKNQKKIIFI
jgi:hypothetical protein